MPTRKASYRVPSSRHGADVRFDQEHVLSYGAGPRHSRLVSVQYAAITAMKNDMRSATPATAAIMVA